MTPNPILNNPYELPLSHYWTNPLGKLDYDRIEHGRRLFVPGLQSIPAAQKAQEEMFSMQEEPADGAHHLVNRLRREVATWRFEGYPHPTRPGGRRWDFLSLESEEAVADLRNILAAKLK